MRRIAATLLLVLSLVASGCSPAPAGRPAAPRVPAAASAAASTTALSGQRIVMANGLTLTVAPGWVADKSLAPGHQSSEGFDHLYLRPLAGAPGAVPATPAELTIMSGAAVSMPPGLSIVARGPGVRVESWRYPTSAALPAAARVPFVFVEFDRPGFEHGAVALGRVAGNEKAYVRQVWKLFHIEGVQLPVGWR